jgi:hypothetical protein
MYASSARRNAFRRISVTESEMIFYLFRPGGRGETGAA